MGNPATLGISGPKYLGKSGVAGYISDSIKHLESSGKGPALSRLRFLTIQRGEPQISGSQGTQAR
jgi:hypothetical protein